MTAHASEDAVVALSKITKSYRSSEVHTPVLHGISLTVKRGEYIALMGASGSGKSTLMNIIGLLDRSDSGTLRFDGVDVTGCAPARLAELRSRTIGFVFQSFNLLKRMSVLDNVALPMIYAGASRSAARQRARETLGHVAMSALADRMPYQLSGGQQQRAAIARALVNRAPLLLADEPTGNLDTKTTSEVLDLLEELIGNQRLTIVLVTHEPEVALRAGRLVRLKDGLVAYDGPPSHRAHA